MPADPYAEFQQPAQGASPYAQFQDPAAAPQDQGVLHGLYNSTIQPIVDTFHQAQANQAASDKAEEGMSFGEKMLHRAKEGISGALENAIPGVSIAKQQAPMFGKAASAATDTSKTPLQRIAGAAGYAGAGLLPGVGPIMAHAGETGATKPNEGMGEALGGLAQMAIPEIAGRAGSALAPRLAETAQGIGAKQRGFSRTPGTAILEETRGIQPSTVAASGKAKMAELNPQLEAAAAKVTQPVASLAPARNIIDQHMAQAVRQNAQQIHGQLEPMRAHLTTDFKPAPMEKTFPAGTFSIKPSEIPGAGKNADLFGGKWDTEDLRRISDYADQLKQGSKPPPILLQANPDKTLGVQDGFHRLAAAKQAGDVPLDAEFRGPNRTITVPGNPEIPENVTPSRLLDLKRGFGQEHASFNPDIHEAVNSTGKRAYGALDSELDRTVPEAAGLNQRMSSLIPAIQRAEATARQADLPQRIAQRVGARTGALTGMVAGAHFGGVPGALLGLIGPELAADPAAQMIAARTLHGFSKIPGKGIITPVSIGAKKDDQNEPK